MKKSFLTVLLGISVLGMVVSCGETPAPEKTLDSISVTKNPTKVEYNVGDAFSLAGLEVTASYSDESKEVVTEYVTSSIADGYVFVATDISKNKTVTVTYARNENEVKSTTFSIKVNRVYEKVLSKIEITTLPTKLEYEVGDTLDLTGLVVTASFENGAQETVDINDTNLTVTGFDSSRALEAQVLTVHYTYQEVEKTTEFTVSIKEKTTPPEPVVTLTRITVQQLPNKVEYKVGEKFSSEGLVVRAHYSNDTTKDLTEGFTLSPISDGQVLNRAVNKQSITVTYQGKYASFDISVKAQEATIVSIRVKTQPTKVEYEIGDEFSSAGIEVEAVYSDGTVKDITANVSYDGFDSSEAVDSQTITITYYNITDVFTTTFTVKIKAAEPTPGPTPTQKELDSIVITTKPTKVEYEIGDEADYTGIVVTVKYSDESEDRITDTDLNKLQFSGFDSSSASDAQTITVSYTEDGVTKSATFTVKIKAAEPTPGPTPAQKELTGIAVTTQPTKTTYDIGDQADYTGIVITATYSNETTATISDLSKLTFNGFSSETSGQKTITVSYTEDGVTKTATFNIGFNEPVIIVQELESIEITQNPTTTTYTVGDSFDETGLKVLAHYTNGKADKELQKEDYTITGFNSSTPVDSQTITVSYTEDEITKTATFTVKIEPAPVIKHLVGFNSNGGSGVMASTEVVEGETYRLPECTFTAPSNKHFVNWLIGEEEHAVGTTITVNADVEVKANWAWNDQVLQSIAIKTNPTTLEYEVGDTFTVAGIEVTATYDFDKGDGQTKTISSGLTYSYSLNPAYTFGVSDIGEDKEVTVSYTEAGVTKTATFEIDVYRAAGYYIEYIGSAKESVKMATEYLTDVNNTAEAINLPVEKNDKFEIVYYDGHSLNGTTKVEGLGGTYGYASFSNHQVLFDGVDNDGYRTGTEFNLYYKDDGTLYLADAKYNNFNGYYLTYEAEHYEFKEGNKMDAGTDGNKAQLTLTLAADQQFKIEQFAGSAGTIDTKAKNSNPVYTYSHFLSNYSEGVFTIREAGKYKLMVGGDDTIYIEDADDGINEVSGYYVVYSSSNYDVRSGHKMDTEHVDSNNYAMLNIDVEIATEASIQVVQYDAVTDVVTVKAQAENKAYLDSEAGDEVITFNADNNYDILLSKNGTVYIDIASYYKVKLSAGVWTNQKGGQMVFFTRPDECGKNSTPYIHCWNAYGDNGWQAMNYLEQNGQDQALFYYEVGSDGQGRPYEHFMFSCDSGWESENIDVGTDCTGYYYYKNGNDYVKNNENKFRVNTYAKYPERTGPYIYAWVWDNDRNVGRLVEFVLENEYYVAQLHSYEHNIEFQRLAYPTSIDGFNSINSKIKYWNTIETSLNNPVKGSTHTFVISDYNTGDWQ